MAMSLGVVRWFMQCAFAAGLLLVSTAQGHAAALYTYTGSAFEIFTLDGPTAPSDSYEPGDRITGSLVLAGPLAAHLVDGPVIPLDFSFNDGVNTFMPANATDRRFRFSTDGLGNIVAWSVRTGSSVFGPGGHAQGLGTSDDGHGSAADGAGQQLCGPNSGPDSCDIGVGPAYVNNANVFGMPGIWQVRAVPESPIAALFGMGVLGAFVLRGRLLMRPH